MYYSSSAVTALVKGTFILASSVILIAGDTNAVAGEAGWDDLASNLSTDATFQVSSSSDWFDQCIRPFADLKSPIAGLCLTNDSIDCPVSNYQFINQPSGLCMAAATCGYEKCMSGPTYPELSFFALFVAPPLAFNSTMYPKQDWLNDEKLDLPEAVVHPIHVGDVSAAIKYAAEHKIEISVKTSGHSYTGSSTKKNTLLLNLSKLQKYSPSGSIVECQVDPSIEEGAFQDACNYAIARNKPAVIRVGGGEIWDEAYHAVFMDWNDNENNTRKYHILGGNAGTVSAAGGWLASGGLSGTANMRSYGLGVDQVLHVEMVLPSSEHVRFGPTEWEKKDGKICPLTTHVKGYCNTGDLSDEELWVWQECSDDIDFHGLWFAVRGGGGGSYGVITSIYYQLHEYSMYNMVLVQNPFSLPKEEQEEVGRKWIEFVLRFFYLPESVGVTEAASNSCSAPGVGGFNGGVFMCYNGAGSIMKGAWERFFSNDALDFTVDTTFPSYAHQIVKDGEGNSKIPEGRANDSPNPWIYPNFITQSSPFTDGQLFTTDYMVFPMKIIVNKLDHISEMFLECLFEGACLGNMYIMGGKIPSADDSMNALPIHRRHAAFMTMIITSEWRTKFKQIIYGVGEGEPFVGKSFPGEICHNHASANFATALKKDWTQNCHPSWSDEMRKDKCLSLQEAAWGTDVLMKLQDIHADVDPDNLFNCWDCVGNAPDIKKEKKKKKNKKAKKKKKKKKMKKKYPDCNPHDWSRVGDGYCDQTYNIVACGFDGGDCN